MRGEKEVEGAIEERSRVYRYTYTYIYTHTRITRFLALAASFYAGAPAELLRGGAENELPWEVATRSTPPSCPASCVSPQPTSDIQGKTDHSPETGLVLLKHRPSGPFHPSLTLSPPPPRSALYRPAESSRPHGVSTTILVHVPRGRNKPQPLL